VLAEVKALVSQSLVASQEMVDQTGVDPDPRIDGLRRMEFGTPPPLPPWEEMDDTITELYRFSELISDIAIDIIKERPEEDEDSRRTWAQLRYELGQHQMIAYRNR